MDENCGSSSVLIILTLEILERAPNDPQTELKFMKTFLDRESQIFIRFALRSAVFKILHISWFPIDSHVKTTKRHKLFVTWWIAKKSNSLYSPMAANVLIKFGWHRMKTVGGVRSVLKFPAPWKL